MVCLIYAYQLQLHGLISSPREETPFSNSARKDSLILRHWRRKGDTANIAGLPATPADSNAASEMDQDDKATNATGDSHFAKYNVRVERPRYTHEQYLTHLESEDWTEDETDYLMNLVTDFDLRWILVGDRYDYQPTAQTQGLADSTAITPPVKLRTMEDLKARYYTVAAKAMVLHNPLSSMSSFEFDSYEKMTKFDPARETQRKRYAEQLMQRTDEEKYEEEMLLKELSRIVSNQEKLFNERKALYERLEAPPTTSRDAYSTTMYQSSQGLTQLMQNLLTQNKNKELEKKDKRRSTMGAGDVSDIQNSDRNQRHSLGGSQDKRYPPQTGSNHRQISRADREKYGITYPQERLTGGVQFRHERVTKAGQAKSGAQTTKIGQALSELNVPSRLLMPTVKVVAEYERLIEGIKTLLEVRKVSEKVDGEIRVWQAQKEQREKRERGEEIGEEEMNDVQAKVEDADAQGEDDSADEAERQSHEAKESDDDGESEFPSSNKKDEQERSEIESEGVLGGERGPELDADDAEEDDDEQDEDEDEEAEEEDDKDQSAESENASEEASEKGDSDVDMDDNSNIVAEDQQAEDEAVGPEDDDDDEGSEQEDDVDKAGTSTRASAVSVPASRSMRKRSASVVSAVSNKSSKRQRK